MDRGGDRDPSRARRVDDLGDRAEAARGRAEIAELQAPESGGGADQPASRLGGAPARPAGAEQRRRHVPRSRLALRGDDDGAPAGNPLRPRGLGSPRRRAKRLHGSRRRHVRAQAVRHSPGDGVAPRGEPFRLDPGQPARPGVDRSSRAAAVRRAPIPAGGGDRLRGIGADGDQGEDHRDAQRRKPSARPLHGGRRILADRHRRAVGPRHRKPARLRGDRFPQGPRRRGEPLPPGRSQVGGRFRRRRGRIPRDPRCPRRGPQGGGDRLDGPRHRRDRNGEGADRPRDPRPEPPQGQDPGQGELRGPSVRRSSKASSSATRRARSRAP